MTLRASLYVIAASLMGAHFFRMSNFFVLGLCLATPPAVFLQKPLEPFFVAVRGLLRNRELAGYSRSTRPVSTANRSALDGCRHYSGFRRPVHAGGGGAAQRPLHA